jgi:hypothetical protein
VLLHQTCGFNKAAEDANVFEGINRTEIDGVADQRHGREGHKAFGKDTMSHFGPLLDPVAFFSDQFWGVYSNVCRLKKCQSC